MSKMPRNTVRLDTSEPATAYIWRKGKFLYVDHPNYLHSYIFNLEDPYTEVKINQNSVVFEKNECNATFSIKIKNVLERTKEQQLAALKELLE